MVKMIKRVGVPTFKGMFLYKTANYIIKTLESQPLS